MESWRLEKGAVNFKKLKKKGPDPQLEKPFGKVIWTVQELFVFF
jgi:hypothetical protein